MFRQTSALSVHKRIHRREKCSSKEQVCFNFMSAVTVHSDFGAQENEI